MKPLTLERCPCKHPNCDSFYVRGLDFGDRGLLHKEQAFELIRRFNCFDALLSALKDAKEHLEYCGYGDTWERECADESKLAEKIETALTAAIQKE